MVSAGPIAAILRDPVTWFVTAYFGFTALNFYTLVTWMPTLYQDHGYSAASSGLLVSVATMTQVPLAVVFSILAARRPQQTGLIVFAMAITGGGFFGVLLAPATAPVLWMLMIGLGQGATFPIALTLFVVRTSDSRDTSRLSAVAQTAGYLIAALGTLVVGEVHDVAGSWGPAVVVLLVLLVPQLGAGLMGGREAVIGH